MNKIYETYKKESKKILRSVNLNVELKTKYRYGVQFDNIDHKYYIISYHKAAEKFIFHKLNIKNN